MFKQPIFKAVEGRQRRHGPAGTAFANGDISMSAKWVKNFLILTYFVVGGFIAWDHGYLGMAWLRTVGSGLLAIIFWWLVPLGVNLHIHG
jgi:hypothetical protein